MTATQKTLTSKATRDGRAAGKPAAGQPPVAGNPSKLELILSMLRRSNGASLAELVAATGWQAHSVRGALAGSLRKKGHVILSEKNEGSRRYRIGAAR